MALKWAEQEAEGSVDPNLLLFAGILNQHAGNHQRAALLLSRSVKVSNQPGLARLLSHAYAWLQGNEAASPYRRELLDLDWRSPDEFFGYLARILASGIPEDQAETAWESPLERDMIAWILALKAMKDSRWQEADALLQNALARVQEDGYTGLLIRSALVRSRAELANRRIGVKTTISAVNQPKKAARLVTDNTCDRILAGLGQDLKTDEKDLLLKMLASKCPDLHQAWIMVAFSQAAQGKWREAVAALDRFLALPGRESGNRLGARLARGQMLSLAGEKDEALRSLKECGLAVADPWYRNLARCAAGEIAAGALESEVADSPEKTVTLKMMLGLKAEGEGNKAEAERQYVAGLESALENWLEYQFALERLKRLRGDENNPEKDDR